MKIKNDGNEMHNAGNEMQRNLKLASRFNFYVSCKTREAHLGKGELLITAHVN